MSTRSGGRSPPLAATEKNKFNIEAQLTLIDECLDALLYQDIQPRPLTDRTRKLIEDAKPKIGEANALFTEGVRRFGFEDVPFKLFAEAEEKGCKHPVLYYFMGGCYRDGRKGVDKDVSKAIEYYEMAVAGGCGWGLLGRFGLPRGLSTSRGLGGEDLHYLLDLEREGHMDGLVFNKIAESYRYGHRSAIFRSKASDYYHRSVDQGFAPAAVNFCNYMFMNGGTHTFMDKGVLSLLEAERKGLGQKDDRIIGELIKMVLYPDDVYIPHPGILGPFKSKGEMALYYGDVLIQRKSALGYRAKAGIYEGGRAGVSKDMAKAVSIWEEAVKEGLADYEICRRLQFAYIKGRGVPVNGLKVLEYGEKALKVARFGTDFLVIFEDMARVYEEGIEPVKKDGRKAFECYERAFQAITSHSHGMLIRIRIADVYVKGLDPISPNGTKALDFYIQALRSGLDLFYPEVYNGMATVYERGIPPVAKNLTLANDLRRLAQNRG